MPADPTGPTLSSPIRHADHSPRTDVPIHLSLCVWRC
jgi:hypothetical protein